MSRKKTILSFSSNFTSTFVITPKTMAQISANYRSSRLTPQGKIYPSFVFNLGVRQDFFKKKVSLLLTVSDLFRTQREKSELNSGYLMQERAGRRDAQIFYIGLSYRFGKVIKKAEEKIQLEEKKQEENLVKKGLEKNKAQVEIKQKETDKLLKVSVGKEVEYKKTIEERKGRFSFPLV